MAEKKARKRSMSPQHKAALAAGRNEGRAVRNYLDALEAHKPKRGRKRTPDSIKKRLAAINSELPEAGARRVLLIQERIDLETELTALDAKSDLGGLETAFVKVAKAYSKRQGISYAAWREAGVEPSVLKRAGVTRAS
jgi:hypothetical protein